MYIAKMYFAPKTLILLQTDPQNYGLVMSYHFSQFCGGRFLSPKKVFQAKQMLEMDSEL